LGLDDPQTIVDRRVSNQNVKEQDQMDQIKTKQWQVIEGFGLHPIYTSSPPEQIQIVTKSNCPATTTALGAGRG
jgi:hypothetical protein